MLYTKTTKEAIINTIGAAMESIPGILYVEYQKQYDQDIDKSKCPGLFVNDLRIDKTKMLKDITRNDFTIGLVGFVWAETGENLSTIMNTFLETIKDKLTVDRTWGGTVYTTNIDVIETDGGSKHPQGIFVIMTTVRFFSTE